VHFTSSDTLATLPANSKLTNGVGKFNATLMTGDPGNHRNRHGGQYDRRRFRKYHSGWPDLILSSFSVLTRTGSGGSFSVSDTTTNQGIVPQVVR